MKKYNITTKTTYQQNGEEKTRWNKVGTITEFDASQDRLGGLKVELNMYPDTKFYTFEDKPREDQATQQFNAMGESNPF